MDKPKLIPKSEVSEKKSADTEARAVSDNFSDSKKCCDRDNSADESNTFDSANLSVSLSGLVSTKSEDPIIQAEEPNEPENENTFVEAKFALSDPAKALERRSA
jgi:hypothetical protein